MYRLHEDIEVQGVYNEQMDMTAEEARNEMISRIRMMTSGERADAVVYLYELDIIDRDRFRELLGIEEKSYNERVHMGTWFSALEERFYSLPDDFLACKEAEILNDFGDC